MTDAAAPPVCPRHPDRISYVSCQRCGRPVCPECQRPAPVGIQCVDCVKQEAHRRGPLLNRLGFVSATGTPWVTYGLIAANVLSFGATIGVSALVFNDVLGFPGGDPSIPLYGFVFLVALGIDYSIFLMTRVREESIRQGTHPGVLKGLSVTGGVITSAGVVLAATFAALSVVPILFLAQIAFIVAFGVLLDTLVVRSLLVPALAYDLGPRVWWPSRLWHTPDHADRETAEMLHAGQADGVRID